MIKAGLHKDDLMCSKNNIHIKIGPLDMKKISNKKYTKRRGPVKARIPIISNWTLAMVYKYRLDKHPINKAAFSAPKVAWTCNNQFNI